MVAAAATATPDSAPMGPAHRRDILFVTPFSLESNPYSRDLVAALAAQGANVRIARGRSPWVLWRGAAGGRPDCVHLQWQHGFFTAPSLPEAVLRTALFFAQWAVLRARGVRFVWTVHNLVNHEHRQARWELFACRILARCVDALIAHCDTAAATVSRTYRVRPSRVYVIEHGVHPLEATPDRTAARAILGFDQDDRVFLCFGRVRRYKGVEPLIDAFARVRGDRLRLVITGAPDDPALAAAVRQQAERDGRIRVLLEHIPDDLLESYLAACDAAILPYRDSLTSGAAILAATHGRALVAPRVGCICDFPPDSGVLYDADSEDGLKRALETAAATDLRAPGAAAQKHVAAFPWSDVAGRTMAVYERVLRGQDRLPGESGSSILHRLRTSGETSSYEQVPAAGAEAPAPRRPWVQHAE